MGNEEAKLFVAGLPDSISEDVLKQLFEATGGKVVAVSLPKDRMTGRPRGFGFVTLATPQEAQAARDALDGSLHAGKSISVRPFQAEPPRRGEGGPMAGGASRRSPHGLRPRAPAPVPRPPIARSTSATCPTTARRRRCRCWSTGSAPDSVVRVHLPMDPDGRKRGFGFVTLASSEAAKTAADALRTADIRGRRLVVNLAHPKGERPVSSGGRAAASGARRRSSHRSEVRAQAAALPTRRRFEEKRKRNFDDGGGAAAGSGRKKAKERGGANKFTYGGDDDE